MHDMGYTFHTINTLTFAEVNLLVNGFNDREKEKAREAKKNSK